ncbi:MAG: hypothetical protein GX755_01650, partial [Syntrophomonadaceae bacterium]|nr:hypothetical protein [Syntrophomonadaceae bacterium]
TLRGDEPGLTDTYGEQPQIQIIVSHQDSFVIRAATANNGEAGVITDLIPGTTDGQSVERLQAGSLNGILEIAVPMNKIGLEQGRKFNLRIIVLNEKGELERWPSHEPLQIIVPEISSM